MRSFILSVLISALFTVNSSAQLPATGIWMTNITMAGGKMTASKPVSITGKNAFNAEPVFSQDGKFIFYTSHSDSLGHTEIYKYQSKTKTSALFTSTADAKHSPGLTTDGKYVSYIVSDQEGHHRLWKMPVAGGTAEPIMTGKDSIGSYCWMGTDSVLLQVLTAPPSLQAGCISNSGCKTISQNAEACIRRMPANLPVPGKWEQCWVFIEKNKSGARNLSSVIYGKKSKLMVMPLCPDCGMLPGVDNFSIIRSGIFCASGSKVLVMDSASETGWSEVADFSKYGITNIKNIVFSPDEKKLLIVSAK